jgi:hypothetical protein
MDQTVAPQFTTTPVVYRSKPALIYWATEASSAHGLVKLQIGTLRRMAEGLGLRMGDRYLQSVPQLSWDAVVVAGPSGASFEHAGNGIAATTANSLPNTDWLTAAREAGHVLVVFCVPSAPTANDLDLRALLGRGQAFVGYATVILPTEVLGSPNRYTAIGLGDHEEAPNSQHAVMLDSNVMVDMEKVASGRSNDVERMTGVQNLILQLIHADVIGGMAIAELSWKRGTTEWDQERASSLRSTMSAWFDGGAQRAATIEQVQAAYRSAQSDSSNEDRPDGFVYVTHLSIYASLLKLAEIWRGEQGAFSVRSRVAAYREFAEWMRDELGVVLSYPLQIARDRFVGPQDSQSVGYVDKLLKFSKAILQNLWGAAWDITHLAHVDQAVDASFLETPGRDVFLMTADAAIISLRKRIRPTATIVVGSSELHFMEHGAELNKLLETKRSEIETIESMLRELPLNRIPIVPTTTRLFEIIRPLEDGLVEK